MKKMRLVLFFTLFATSLFAQNPLIRQFYGEKSTVEWLQNGFRQPDKSLQLFGTSGSDGHGGYDFWQLRLDSSGLQIGQQFFGTEENEMLRSAVRSTDGGWFLAGQTGGRGLENKYDGWLVKLDATSNILFEKRFSSPDFETISSVAAMPDDGCVALISRQKTASENQFQLVRLDKTGAIVWQNPTENGLAHHLISTPDGSIFLAKNDGAERLNSMGETVWTTSFYEPIFTAKLQKGLQFSQSAFDSTLIFIGQSEAGNVFFLNKINQNGSVLWQKQLSASTSDFFENVKTRDSDGQIAVLFDGSLELFSPSGDSLFFRDFNTNALGPTATRQRFDLLFETGKPPTLMGKTQENFNAADGLVEQLDDTLGIAAATFFGLKQFDGNESARAAVPLPNGGFFLFGNDRNPTTGSNFWHSILTDSTGKIEAEIFDNAAENRTANAIEPTADGGFLLTGRQNLNGQVAIVLRKTDGAGLEIWTKTWPFGFVGTWSQAVELPNGDLAMAFTAGQNFSSRRAKLMRLNAQGDSIWVKNMSTNNLFSLQNLQKTPDNRLIMTGSSGSLANFGWVVKTTLDGDLIFETSFSVGPPAQNASAIYGLAPLPDGGCVVTGAVDFSSPSELDSVFVARLTAFGTVAWQRFLTNGPPTEHHRHFWPMVSRSTDGSLVVSSTTEGNFLENQADSLSIWRLDAAGNPIWQRGFVGYESLFLTDNRQTTDGKLMFFGQADEWNSADFHLLVTDKNGSPTAVFSPKSWGKLTISPNPTHGPLDILLENDWLGELKIEVFDATGRLFQIENGLKTEPCFSKKLGLPNGLAGPVFIRLSNGTFSVGKIILRN